eukprot:gene1489-1577_t
MEEDFPLFIIYFIFATCGIVGSFHVLFTIWFSFDSCHTCSTLLVLFLHLSLVSEEITALPFLFKYNSTLCQIIESFFEYFGLMNIVVIGLIVYAHRWSILDPTIRIPRNYVNGGIFFVLVFPMITFLPFIDKIYVTPDSPWCSLPYSSGLNWVLGVYLIWVWMVLIMSLLSSFDLAHRLMTTSGKLFRSYLTTIGMYTVVSLLCWIPRTIVRFSGNDTNTARFAAYIPIYVSGMLYSLIFRYSRKNMEMYEQSRLQTIDLPSGDLVFLFDENDRLNSVSTSSTERLLEEEERRSKHQKRTSQQFAEFLNFEEI